MIINIINEQPIYQCNEFKILFDGARLWRVGPLGYCEKIADLFRIPLFSKRIQRRIIYSARRINNFLFLSCKLGLFRYHIIENRFEKVCDGVFGKSLFLLDWIGEDHQHYLLFSPYSRNRSMKPVPIFKMAMDDCVVTVLTELSEGICNHVHNGFVCGGRLFFSVGDSILNSGLWEFSSDRGLQPFATGESEFRSVVGASCDRAITIVGDVPSGPNFLKKIGIDVREVKTLSPLNGPCIFGGVFGSKLLFSTSSEPKGTNFLQSWVCDLIRSPVVLYSFDLFTGELCVIDTFKKSALPTTVFGFGVALLPLAGEELTSVDVMLMNCRMDRTRVNHEG